MDPVAHDRACSYMRTMTTRGAFVAPIHDLDSGGRDYHFGIPASWVRGALEECEMQPSGREGSLDVHLTKAGHEVLVQGQVDVELVVPCARCLAPVQLRPHTELTLLLHPASGRSSTKPPAGGAGGRAARSSSHAGDDDASFEQGEADIDTYEGEEVVLDKFVREAILLESPTFPLCSDACEGIRPASVSASPPREAGADPRLLPLLELAKRRNLKE